MACRSCPPEASLGLCLGGVEPARRTRRESGTAALLRADRRSGKNPALRVSQTLCASRAIVPALAVRR
jgi:hypothetical protein